jgi:membrane-bound serine protease (ClpP class)
MKRIGLLLILLSALMLSWGPAAGQGEAPLALVLKADGPIIPAMEQYIKRGIQSAEAQGAEILVIELNTPGGDLGSMINIMQAIRASHIPVIVYVAPNGSMAGSAGAMITMAGHASAMAPETAIGASSPISSSGANLDSDARAKATQAVKALIRPLVERRGPEALKLAEAMIDQAKAATAKEALAAGLIDFIAVDTNDLLQKLDGFEVETAGGPLVLHTRDIHVQSLNISIIEQLLLMLTDPNIAFLLLAIGVQAILIEISSPGGWVAGFIGVVCLSLAVFGMGVLPVNWFGLIFVLTAFVLFILDIKAPTHGALTAAGVASFIVGALVLFNSPGVPQFQRVSVPLVIGTGIFLGLVFAVILGFALRAQLIPVRMGTNALVGKTGIAKTAVDSSGQVQLESELWSAEATQGSGSISKGDRVEVVNVEGLRLKVKKKD